MGKIISVVGNLGAGKTTLTGLLCERGGYVPYWEKPEERPFQASFTKDMQRWALPNQIDFLLYRSQQELVARENNHIAIMDGGLDQDYQVFTKNLVKNGYLSQAEFNICERFYHFVRSVLPPPDVVIRIIIDTPLLMQRRLLRPRKTVDEGFDKQVFVDLELLLDDWINHETSYPIIRFAFDRDIQQYDKEIDALILQINEII